MLHLPLCPLGVVHCELLCTGYHIFFFPFFLVLNHTPNFLFDFVLSALHFARQIEISSIVSFSELMAGLPTTDADRPCIEEVKLHGRYEGLKNYPEF